MSKLVAGRFVTQIGWLYPLAGAALVFGLVGWFRRRGRTDRLGTGLVLWGVWLATVMVVFSNINIPHTAYLAALAAPLSALSALGIVEFWRAYRGGGRTAWLMPLVVAGQVGWSVYLTGPYGYFLPWLTPVVVTTGVVAVAALVVGLLARRGVAVGGRRLGVVFGFVRRRGLGFGGVAAVAGVVAMVLMPTAWSLSAFDRSHDGSAMDATAGPVGGGRGLGFVRANTLSDAQGRLLSYVDAHKGGARYVMATTSWSVAAPFIVSTGQMVLPMGGFSGTVPQPTLAAFEQLVRTRQVAFVLDGGGLGAFDGFGAFGGGLGRGFGFGGARRGTGSVASIARWVQSACTVVPAVDYGNGDAAGGALYRCVAGDR